MATTIKTTHRSLVALSLPRSVPALIVYAEGIVKRMTGNPSFADAEEAADWSQPVSLMIQ